MKMMKVAALGVGISLAAGGAALAADPGGTGMMNGVTHGAMGVKARCSPGDPNVLMDEKTKTYTMDTSMMKNKPGTTPLTSKVGEPATAAGADTTTAGSKAGISTAGTSGSSTGNGAVTGTVNASVNGTTMPAKALPGEATIGPIPTPAPSNSAATGAVGAPGSPRMVSMCRSEAMSMGAKMGPSGSMMSPNEMATGAPATSTKP